MDEVYEAKKTVKAMIEWNNPIDEKTSLVEAICKNYEVLIA